MRDTNGVIGPDGDIGYEQPIKLKALAGFGVVAAVFYAAVSYFGTDAVIAGGAVTIGVIVGLALKR